MTGKIKLGLWLPFTAEQDCDGSSFEWRARIGLGPLALLEVVDRYANGTASVTGRLLGRYQLFHQADENVRIPASTATASSPSAGTCMTTAASATWSAQAT
jgi:hypothetical protein